MIKQIEIHGQRVKLYSSDKGRTWASSPQSIVAYGQRKRMLRCDLQKTFERLEVQDLDLDIVTELEIPNDHHQTIRQPPRSKRWSAAFKSMATKRTVRLPMSQAKRSNSARTPRTRRTGRQQS